MSLSGLALTNLFAQGANLLGSDLTDFASWKPKPNSTIVQRQSERPRALWGIDGDDWCIFTDGATHKTIEPTNARWENLFTTSISEFLTPFWDLRCAHMVTPPFRVPLLIPMTPPKSQVSLRSFSTCFNEEHHVSVGESPHFV